MADLINAFVSKAYLRSVWNLEYGAFQNSPQEAALLQRLQRWADRKDLGEVSSQGAFVQEFFQDTWGYSQTGQAAAAGGQFTMWPQFPVPGAGEKGGTGAADLAIGTFDAATPLAIPQVLCEFKDVGTSRKRGQPPPDLDAPQKRKGNTRSPVRQCLDYLQYAKRLANPSDPVQPTWGIVTDMNEFRLYWADKGHHQYLRFTIRPASLLQGSGLLDTTDAARFDRFLFARIFHRDTLIAPSGRSALAALIVQQRFRDRDIEKTFYADYRRLRDGLYTKLLARNGNGSPRYPGTDGRLVRLAQKILDRFIFIFYCEDMGQVLSFPPKLLQEFLIARAADAYFDGNATTIWQDMLRLFDAMNAGTAFGGKAINQFNGGLFAPDPVLEALQVPNSFFCQHMQGANEATLYTYPETLLYLCASYNYASDIGQAPGAHAFDRDPKKSLGLYTLGRIFEQSITELEIAEAQADGRPSINLLSKRKRDGVYYTPEWVVDRIVDETLGPVLARIKTACGWPSEGTPSVTAIEAYATRLKAITVVDPACGSGAFLITALRYLVQEWRELRGMRRELTGQRLRDDDDEAGLIAELLSRNIYGVDINAASVEIARLALWLHTARGDRPLSALDANIREGNSLIGPEFYLDRQGDLYGDADKERINAFDWRAAFPEVFAAGGFDAVVGNPPYVKLQHFRKAQPDAATFLRDGTSGQRYASTQTGNFDLYLPFIERGIELLNEGGRLGYIAPSLWITNEYGAGLRNLIGQRRHLANWIDFKSFQVFDEAITYTALQFFTRAPAEAIRIAFAPDGVVPTRPWEGPDCALPYGKQVFGERWLLLTGPERALIDRLAATCRRLDDPAVTAGIFVGLQTSADAIYHLRRIAPGRYVCSPDDDGAPAYEVPIEDALMKPLVSGAEAKRYITPRTDTYLLFPYSVDATGARLIDAETMQTHYPLAWAYLRSFRDRLRLREAKRDRSGNVVDAPFDDDAWYRFGRHQNLDKQEIVKLVVPRLVAGLGCSVDESGTAYLDNVDVGGVAIAEGMDPFFVAAIVNAPVANFVFREISKPFRGEFRSANKQFIAPLPIPRASEPDQRAVADRARALQAAHTERRDVLLDIERRLSATRARSRPETWLFPDHRPARDLLADAPTRLSADERSAWADATAARDLSDRYDAITARLVPGAVFAASFTDGELAFMVDGVPVVNRIFVGATEGAFIAAQWHVAASTFTVKEATTGKTLAAALRRVAITDNAALIQQVVERQQRLAFLDSEIARQEAEMNAVVNRLYGLTDGEAALVAGGRASGTIP